MPWDKNISFFKLFCFRLTNDIQIHCFLGIVYKQKFMVNTIWFTKFVDQRLKKTFYFRNVVFSMVALHGPIYINNKVKLPWRTNMDAFNAFVCPLCLLKSYYMCQCLQKYNLHHCIYYNLVNSLSTQTEFLLLSFKLHYIYQ